MSTYTSLPFIPVAQPNESPLSLLRRSAIGNGYSNLLALLHSLEPNIDHSIGMLGFVARNPALFQTLCHKLSIANKCYQKTVYLRAGNAREDNVIWQKLEIEMGDLEFHTEKICIPCFIENEYTRSEWDHFAINCCPVHQIYLDHCCPVCKTPWSYDQTPLTCDCHHSMILKNLRPIEQYNEALIRDAVSVQNQSLFYFLSNLRHLFNWWKTLGISLNQEQQSAFISSFSQGLWPELTANLFPDLHIRSFLLPLIAANDELTCTLTEKLVEYEANNKHNRNLRPPVYLNRYQAQLLLNISRSRFNHFVHENLVNKSNTGEFSLKEINALLEQSSWLPFTKEKAKQWRQNRRIGDGSLAAQIKREISGAIENSHSEDTLDSLTINDTAKRLSTNSESVRFLIKLKLLKAHKGTDKSAVQWAINESELDDFEKKYIFASKVAKQVGLPVTTTSSRLRSQGVQPVSGPSIDDGKTFLFLKNDIVSLDVNSLKGDYQSPAGRKEKSQSNNEVNLSSHRLASLLNVDMHDIRYIVDNGWVKASKNTQGNYLFKLCQVNQLLETISSNYIDIEQARAATNQSLQSFRRTWLISGFVSEHQMGKRKLITKENFHKILAIWKENKTSAYIARQLGRHHSLCINLEKMGLLSPTYIIGEKSKKIKLYPNDHSIYLKYTKISPSQVQSNSNSVLEQTSIYTI